ncbi:hypothetical protein JMUB7528_28510 [Staphylococcus aureus]
MCIRDRGKYLPFDLHLEKKLESGLYCELTDKELKDSYVEYTLLYDTIASRISIDEVEAKDGKPVSYTHLTLPTILLV